MQRQLEAGDNVILLANHQTEADPGVFALLLEASHPNLATDVIYVAGTAHSIICMNSALFNPDLLLHIDSYDLYADLTFHGPLSLAVHPVACWPFLVKVQSGHAGYFEARRLTWFLVGYRRPDTLFSPAAGVEMQLSWHHHVYHCERSWHL